mmetsp:Transcript_200/g.249  ORF Transcript_200/g.249 Transcript_200/m.249 type:complete len:85 (-) Transcript_200:78-332(-)
MALECGTQKNSFCFSKMKCVFLTISILTQDQVLWGRTEDTTATDCTEFAVEFGQTPIGCSPHKITSTAKEVSLVNIAPSECQDD